MILIVAIADTHIGILNDDVPKDLFLEHFFMRRAHRGICSVQRKLV